ncbi:serine protease [Photobacterium chitinilyticum]|uniref:S1 family peptidase n=1 Tax=Photobacterium chitinilyticum TaxID=2485123 RepID=UPI003D121CDD
MYKTSLRASAVLLALATTQSIAATPVTKAINGNNASAYGSLLLPWQAAIKQTLSDYTGCGAVVIAENWVVTAAHCDVALIGNVVIAGTSYIPQGDLTKLDDKYKFKVIEYKRIQNSDFDSVNVNHDIALFRVDRSLYSVAQPIKVATIEEQATADQEFANTWVAGADSKANLIASGWGDTVTKGTTPSDLQVVKLGGIPDDQCNNTMTDYNSFVCADSNIANLVKDVCAGDSGGPIIWQNPSLIGDTDKGLRLVGVTSNGADCNIKNSNADNPAYQLNGQYTQLSTYRTWIEKTIRDEDSNPSFSLSGIATPTFSQDPFTVVEDRPKSTTSSGGSSGGSLPFWGLGFLSLVGFFRRHR